MEISVNSLLKKLQMYNEVKTIMFIGIDGCGGVGKTTLAETIARHMGSVTVVHMDEFDLPYKDRLNLTPSQKPIGADTDWKRLIEQVISPLKNFKIANYQRYSWAIDQMEDWVKVVPKGIIVIEGVYATRKELAPFYDMKVWIDCPTHVRLERGIKRDGESSRERWLNDWLPMEEEYMKRDNPRERADYIIRTG